MSRPYLLKMLCVVKTDQVDYYNKICLLPTTNANFTLMSNNCSCQLYNTAKVTPKYQRTSPRVLAVTKGSKATKCI